MHPDDITRLPSQDRERLRTVAQNDLYFMARGVLGYNKLVPHVHMEPCRFFSNPPGKRIGHLGPRDHYKTTVGISDIVRRITRQRDIRILVVNESAVNAELILGSVAKHFENNRKFRNLFPEVIPKNFKTTTWSNKALLVERDQAWTEPTVSAIGTGGAVVSRHFNLLIFDDFIGLEAHKSPTVMTSAKKYLTYAVPALFVDPEESEVHIRGTRWGFDDAYNFAMEKMGFQFLVQKSVVMGPNGPEPLFPELISLKTLQGILETDPEHFATHYQNDPYDTSNMDFQQSWIKYYTVGPDRAIRYTDNEGMLHRIDPETLWIYTHVDPSLGENKKSDPAAFITVGIAPGPLIFILEAFKKKISPIEQVSKMMEIQETWQPEMFSIEHVGYQKALKYFAEEEAVRRGIYLNIKPYTPPRNTIKRARIKGRLQPYMKIGSIYMRSDMFQLIEEILQFGKTEEDHLLDALAQGPEFWQEPMDDRQLLRLQKHQEEMMKPRGVTGYGA